MFPPGLGTRGGLAGETQEGSGKTPERHERPRQQAVAREPPSQRPQASRWGPSETGAPGPFGQIQTPGDPES